MEHLPLKATLDRVTLSEYIANQLNTFFPDGKAVKASLLLSHMAHVLEKVHYCFSHVNNRYFSDGKNTLFNHLNADQYAMFLYLLSRDLYTCGCDTSICDKVFYLNKMLHAIDVFYEVELPDIFLFVHPLGTVLGRAKYSDFFMVYQGCGIGSNHDIYPTVGKYVSLHPGSSILGKCTVGDNCKISVNSTLLDHSLEADSIYIGKPKRYVVKASFKKANVWLPQFLKISTE